jgi:hypothetical protein
MQNGRLMADLKNSSPVPLLHVQGNKYMAGRFKIQKNVNVDVEFRYDPKRSRYALYIIPFQSASLVLTQNPTPAN